MISSILLTTILWLLPCSMALPSNPGVPQISKHSLGKRLLPVLECSSQAPIPPYPGIVPPNLALTDPLTTFLDQVKTFKTRTSLCGSYPIGMGYYCPPAGGQIRVQMPASAMYQFSGPPDSSTYLKSDCMLRCHCVQIGPDEPVPSSSKPASAQCLSGVDESDAEAGVEVDAGGCMETYNDPEADDGVICDTTGNLYGHPADEDCKAAQDGVGDDVDDSFENQEFLAVGAESTHDGYTVAQTPYNWTSRTCYINLSMREGGDFASTSLENWDYIFGRVMAIREKCVAGLGVGGFAAAGGDVDHAPKSIGIYISGVDSKLKVMLDMRYGCVPDADGNYSCDEESGPPAKKQKTSPPSSPSDAGGAQAPARLEGGQQSGSCVNHKDCDYRNGYTCAATKKATDGFPVHASFGTFTCRLASTIATGAVAAAKAYAALGPATCHNRCLLDSNGTFDILANTTTASDATGPEPDPYMADMLVSPCNCTYVSAACVFAFETGIVHEGPGARILTTLGNDDQRLCCDQITGQWRDRPGNGNETAAAAAGNGNGSLTNSICPDAVGGEEGSGTHLVNLNLGGIASGGNTTANVNLTEINRLLVPGEVGS